MKKKERRKSKRREEMIEEKEEERKIMGWRREGVMNKRIEGNNPKKRWGSTKEERRKERGG